MEGERDMGRHKVSENVSKKFRKRGWREREREREGDTK
jgi:hypothetical protein